MSYPKSSLSPIPLAGLILFCLLSIITKAQKGETEIGGTECGQSKVITLPFVKDTGRVKANSQKHLLNQYNQYEQIDQFSYWYKLNIEADMNITCQITSVNKADRYMIYIYKYKEDDFCEKVFKNKIKPARVENEENKKSIIEASESSDFEFEAHSGDRFYFSILSISKNNCGHNLTLITGGDTLKVATAHAPCVGLVKESTVAPLKVAEIKQTVDTVAGYKQVEKKFDTVMVIANEVNKPGSKLSAKIKAIDVLSGKPMRVIYSKDNSTIRLVYERGRKYTIECTSTGYKTFNHQMMVSEYINPANNSFVIFMKPLKSGDNFVMDNIYFFPNTYALKDKSMDALNSLLNYMNSHPEVKIELQGHTNGNNRCRKNKRFKDEGPEWNFSGTAQKLSLLRAEEIKKYLAENGVNGDNITTVGFGGQRMIVPNPKSAEAIKKNARVEVVILDDGGL